MSLCAAAGGVLLAIAAESFTLAWTHSVERVEWRERWQVDGGSLRLVESRVQGSGAGMEPPDGAVLRDGWWVAPASLRVPVLRLAVSGATGSGWRLCIDGAGCRDLERLLQDAGGGRRPGVIALSPGRCPCTPARSWP
ncbi:MAG: DUF1850 domain-containing protein [Rubrivivax sp.]